jgi:hypothetical protein
VRNKMDAQVKYRVSFWRSIYGWKHNFIELPMAPVSCQNFIGVNSNHWNKLTSRICQSVASTVYWALGPCWGRPTPSRPHL